MIFITASADGLDTYALYNSLCACINNIPVLDAEDMDAIDSDEADKIFGGDDDSD